MVEVQIAAPMAEPTLFPTNESKMATAVTAATSRCVTCGEEKL